MCVYILGASVINGLVAIVKEINRHVFYIICMWGKNQSTVYSLTLRYSTEIEWPQSPLTKLINCLTLYYLQSSG